MRRLALTTLLALLALAPAARAAGINVFIGVPAIQGGGATAVALDGFGDIPAPAVTGGGSGATANLWVDSNGGTCTRQASPAAYSDAAACSTFNAAYTAASTGDSVLVRAGTYAAQSITATNKSAGSNITFAPDTGATVTVNGIDVESSYVTVRGFGLNGNDFGVGMEGAQTSHQDVTSVTGDQLDGRSFRIFSATNVTISNGDWGPVQPDGAAGGENNKLEVAAGVPSYDQVADVTITGNTIHDFQAADLVAHHIECIAIFSGNGTITLRRNKFWNCSVMDTFIKNNGTGGTITGTYVFENNMWGAARDTVGGGGSNGQGLVFCTQPTQVKVIHNAFQSGGSYQPDSCDTMPPSGSVMQGNYGYAIWNVCSYTGLTRSYNAWIDRSACTGTGEQGNVTDYFVNGAVGSAMDLHITASATALLAQVPAGSSSLSIADDYDGDTRATTYDIGADER